MTSKHRKLKTASTYRKTCECGTVDSWTYSTNGDGASVQICAKCGTVYPVGKFWCDEAVGVRIIAHSTLSALKTFTVKEP